MKALVLVAHGSRRKVSNEEIIALSKVITEEMKGDFPIVEAGFLEFAEPGIPEAINDCIEKGATDVCVMPYFLSAGRHVFEDVPDEVNKARKLNKHIPMTVLPHIGGMPQMVSLVRESVMNSRSPS